RRRRDAARMCFGRVLVRAGDHQAGKSSEWRIVRLLSQCDFACIERLAVTGDQRAHHRMLGLVGLQIADAAPLLTTGTADDLVQELKGALGRARITVRKTEIGVDDAHEIEFWKMMPFGDKLRPD